MLDNRIAERRRSLMKPGDIVIYACVIIGAGVGLVLGQALPGVLIGLGVGYLIKQGLYSNKNQE